MANGFAQEENLPVQEERHSILEHARLVLARSRALAETLDRTTFRDASGRTMSTAENARNDGPTPPRGSLDVPTTIQ